LPDTPSIGGPVGWSGQFPTRHPVVPRLDGEMGGSNVVLSGFTFELEDGIVREFLIPTMVGGKQLSDEEAIAVAEEHGLGNYPSFAEPGEASAWAEANHHLIDESGKWTPEVALGGLSPKVTGGLAR